MLKYQFMKSLTRRSTELKLTYHSQPSERDQSQLSDIQTETILSEFILREHQNLLYTNVQEPMMLMEDALQWTQSNHNISHMISCTKNSHHKDWELWLSLTRIFQLMIGNHSNTTTITSKLKMIEMLLKVTWLLLVFLHSLILLETKLEDQFNSLMLAASMLDLLVEITLTLQPNTLFKLELLLKKPQKKMVYVWVVMISEKLLEISEKITKVTGYLIDQMISEESWSN